MARRRQLTAATTDGVPAELTDPDHPVWADPAASTTLADQHGLTLDWRWSPLRDSAFSRFDAFRTAWATQHGYTNHYSPDLHRLRTIGVYASARSPRTLGGP